MKAPPASGIFLAVLSISACAPSPHRHPARGCGDPSAEKSVPGVDPNAALERRLEALKPELQLSQDQEKSWNVLLDNLRESGEPPTNGAARRPPVSGTDRTRAALDRFYASLTPEQRTTLDKNIPRTAPPCLDDGPPSPSIYGHPRPAPGQ